MKGIQFLIFISLTAAIFLCTSNCRQTAEGYDIIILNGTIIDGTGDSGFNGDIGIKGDTIVAVGDLGYWPVGSAFCIFFGPTPVSQGEEPRAYSPVNIFGKVVGDATTFKQVHPPRIHPISDQAHRRTG